MLFLKDCVGIKRYKQASYFVYTDFEGNKLEQNSSRLSKYASILFWKDLKDGGVCLKLAVYNKMPKDYKLLKNPPRAPYGYRWIYNKKQPTNKLYIGLLKLNNMED